VEFGLQAEDGSNGPLGIGINQQDLFALLAKDLAKITAVVVSPRPPLIGNHESNQLDHSLPVLEDLCHLMLGPPTPPLLACHQGGGSRRRSSANAGEYVY